ncbi:hypothetical protein IW261DRAFT_1614915 [Armillaria novae-zelandiae]|uniref:F-box domain-containing protein n=1 Tax=Armillaria novae-zelandiae TaxID=153914 RepID=A0AA39KEY6_9AGAR|nr:hypothetical protein IW261DRAFT_1614915 [Armillaria novae-zelandiae]
MDVPDAMCHLDALARSVPEPVLPPDALNTRASGILRATRPLLDTDRDCIQQNIEDLQQQLSGYDALLNRIDEVRSEIQRRRDAVHRSMATYSSTLAPIRRLPREIFCAVFREVQILLWCNLEGTTAQYESRLGSPLVLDFSQGPWNLSYVCGAWRDIVLSYPQLWSHIVLRFWACEEYEKLHHTIPALQAMILRSGQHPLDIAFAAGYWRNEVAAMEALPMIIEESYRWRSIELNLNRLLLEKFKVVRGKIPLLESLRMEAMHIPSYHRYELPKNVRSMFIDAPRLRKAAVSGTYELGEFMFPLHITHLATYVDDAPSLEAYQSLVECRLVGTPDPDNFPPHPIHLPNLRRLFIRSPRLLAHLRLPFLDHLMISWVGESDGTIDGTVLVINEFVHRSRCTLTSLAIDNSLVFDEAFIKDCLQLMDSLVSLQLGATYHLDVEFIFDSLASSKFLPNLQHLSLQIPCGSCSLLKPLAAMISSRSRYLRSISISCDRDEDAERIDEYLAPLRLPGLPIVVSLDDGSSHSKDFESE